MKRVLPVSSDPPRAAPSPNAQNGNCTYILGLKFNDDDFGRERIDDDGVDDAVGDYAD
jgi:hypothetical protein